MLNNAVYVIKFTLSEMSSYLTLRKERRYSLMIITLLNIAKIF